MERVAELTKCAARQGRYRWLREAEGRQENDRRESHFLYNNSPRLTFHSLSHALCSFQEMTLLAKVLLEDAKRRINKKESLPEPEDQMTAPVKKLVQQGVSVLCTHSVILSSDLYGFVVKCFLY